MSDRDYLKSVSLEDFDKLIPERRRIIEAASDELPKYEYNANILAKNLHPAVQYVIVSEIKDLNGAKHYTLIPDREAGTESLAYFRAGQYLSLQLKVGTSVLTRPYSICSSPKEALSRTNDSENVTTDTPGNVTDTSNGKYEIVVKQTKNGFASDYIHNEFKVGTKLNISEPSGLFYYEPLRDQKTVIAIAGGSGIAPFLSLAKAIADGTEDFDLTILYGSRTESEILFSDEFSALMKECERIKVVHVLSVEEKEGYEHGLITADLIKKYAPLYDFSIFVCGSQEMYDYIKGECNKLYLKPKYVRFDSYGEYHLTDRDAAFTAEHGGKTYQLTVATNDGTNKTVPAKAEESLLVALERAGIKAPSKCRSGECGFCRSHLVSGEVYIPKKVDYRRQYDKETSYIHPCCAFPRSDCKILINLEEPKTERKVKDMKKKERLMGLIMSIIMSAAMGALASFLVLKSNPQAAMGMPVPVMYISNILVSVTVGIIVCFVIPLGKLGRALAKAAHANPPGFKFTLLNSIPMAVGNSIIVGLVVSFFGVFMSRIKAPAEAVAQMPPLPIMWLGSYARILLPTLIVSYLLSVILSPLVSQMIGLADAGAEVGRAAGSEDK